MSYFIGKRFNSHSKICNKFRGVRLDPPSFTWRSKKDKVISRDLIEQEILCCQEYFRIDDVKIQRNRYWPTCFGNERKYSSKNNDDH